MTRRPLPTPATQVDEYLFDIAVSLRQLGDLLAQTLAEPAVGEGEVVALREPEPVKPKKRAHRDQVV